MKNYYVFLSLLAVLCVSCSKSKDVPVVTAPVIPVPPKDTVTAPDVKVRKIDSIRNAIKSNAGKFTVLTDSVWANNTGITFRVEMTDNFNTTEFAVQPDIQNRIYPGSLIKGNSVVDLQYTPVTGYQQNSLFIYSTSPRFEIVSKKVLPSLSATQTFIKESFKPVSGGQVDLVDFQNGTAFTNYSEISMNTRTSWDFSKLVILKPGDKGHIKKKNGFYVSFNLSIFSVVVDPVTEEGSFFAPGVNVGSIPDNPLIVSSVTYGRKAVIAIESDADFAQIKAAFQSAVNNNATDADQKLLKEATIVTYMTGFNNRDTESVNAAQGYDRVSLFVKTLTASGTYTKEEYGVPTGFYCNTVSNFATARYKFKFRLDYPVY